MKGIKRSSGLVVLMILVMLVLSACGGGSQLKADVVVNESQNGTTIMMKNGQVLEVMLSSNPAEGYRWKVANVDSAVLEQAGDPIFKKASDQEPAPAGKSGWGVFQFKAVGAGQTVLEMVYQKTEEGSSPENTFTIQVVVE